MNVNANTQVNWFRLGVEGVVIVASILLAFALDSWREDRKDAETEREMLVALADELEGARSMLEDHIRVHEEHADAAKSIADQLVAAGPTMMVSVRDRQIAELVNNPTYDPPFGIAGALLDSGQASLIRNPKLRAALGRWPAAIADGVEDQIMLLEHAKNRIEPLLHRSVHNMQPAYYANTLTESARDSDVATADTSSEIVASPEFWNSLYQRHSRTRIAQADLRRTREQLLELIELVNQELE